MFTYIATSSLGEDLEIAVEDLVKVTHAKVAKITA